MGRPMAMNLARHGADLTACATSAASLAPFHEAGVRATTNLSDVAQCEIVFLCLPNGDVVRDVVLGEGSLSGPGSRVEVIVDTSTIAHARAVEMGRERERCGTAFGHAPGNGVKPRAAAATLPAICGGRRDAFERVQPLLSHVAS